MLERQIYLEFAWEFEKKLNILEKILFSYAGNLVILEMQKYLIKTICGELNIYEKLTSKLLKFALTFEKF